MILVYALYPSLIKRIAVAKTLCRACCRAGAQTVLCTTKSELNKRQMRLTLYRSAWAQ